MSKSKPSPPLLQGTHVPVNMLAATLCDWREHQDALAPPILLAIATESYQGHIPARGLGRVCARYARLNWKPGAGQRVSMERFLAEVGRVCRCPFLTDVRLWRMEQEEPDGTHP